MRFRASADIFRRFRTTGAETWPEPTPAALVPDADLEPDVSPGKALRIEARSSSISRKRDAAPKRAHLRISTVCFVAMSRA